MSPSRLRRLLADPAALADAAAWRLRRAAREGPGRAAEAARERLFPLRVRHLAGPRRVEAGPTDLVVVCLVRDGAVYLDGFLEHYRALGARHVVFLDNGSTDGTVERAAAEPGVTVLQTHAPYKTHKVITKRYLIERFGRGCWALCVDIDELFDYPRRADVPLGSFLGYLNGRGFTAVVAYLLDLFPSGPLAEAGDWRSEHRLYALDALRRLPYAPKVSPPNRISNSQIEWYNGGVREARFGVRPNLTKHPLQFPSGGVRHESSHHAAGARVADVTGVLLHYKYAAGFLDYAERLVAEQSFYDGSAEYVGYLDAFAEDPAFRLDAPGSREYGGPDRLEEEGFLVTSEAYRAFADARAARPAAPVSGAGAPAVSVLLPVYNGLPYLREALDSVLAQTFEDFELVAVDDGSTDGTAEVLADYAERDRRVRVVRQPNGGVTAALNRGLERVRAPLVARLDADDVALPERLAAQVAFMEAHPGCGVLGSAAVVLGPGGERRGVWSVPTHPDLVRWQMAFSNCLIHPTVMFRADVVRAAGGYDESVRSAQDYVLWARLMRRVEVRSLAAPLVLKRQWGGRMTRSGNAAQEEVAVRVMAEAVGSVLGRPPDVRAVQFLRSAQRPADWPPPPWPTDFSARDAEAAFAVVSEAHRRCRARLADPEGRRLVDRHARGLLWRVTGGAGALGPSGRLRARFALRYPRAFAGRVAARVQGAPA